MPAEKFPIRRILVAMDASPQSFAALHAAVELGVKLEAQLLGLFVEDIELLRLASSPYARELLLPTARETPLDRAGMERKLKAHAELVRKALAMAADRAKVKWAFRVARGSVPSEILAAAAGCDLVALGRRGWSLAKKSYMGSTALAAIREAVPTLLLSTRGMFADQRILAWYDGTQTSKKGILAAAELARICSRKLTVLLPLREQNSSSHLHEQVAHFLKGKEIQLTFVRINDPDKGELNKTLQSAHPTVIVLTGKEPFSKREDLIALLDTFDVSALLLGDGRTFELE